MAGGAYQTTATNAEDLEVAGRFYELAHVSLIAAKAVGGTISANAGNKWGTRFMRATPSQRKELVPVCRNFAQAGYEILDDAGRARVEAESRRIMAIMEKSLPK